MALQFKKGDKVIYPNHGIGIIERVMDRQIGDIRQSFYSLRILANDSTVMVPIDNTREVGLRPIASKREVDRLFRVLKDGNLRVTPGGF